jgi:hypothetical protein
MMAKAGRYHAVRGLALGLLLAAATVTGLALRGQVVEQHQATEAAGLVQAVLNADTAQVPAIIGGMAGYRRWVDPLLREQLDKAAANSSQQLHASLALLPVDATQVAYLYGRLLEAKPGEVPVLRDALAPHQGQLVDKLWAVAEKPETGKQSQRLRAAAALAQYDPKNRRWAQVQEAVADDLLNVPGGYLGAWMDSLRPVRLQLLAPLSVVFGSSTRREVERSLAMDILVDYAADQPKVLADVVMDADERQFTVLFPKLKECGERGVPTLAGEIDRRLPTEVPSSDDRREKLAKRQANAAVALLQMKRPAQAWPVLKHGPDPRARSYLIHRLYPLGVDAGAIIKHLDEESDVTIRRALLLSLGQYGEPELPAAARQALVPKLQALYRTDADPGHHAAAEWQ